MVGNLPHAYRMDDMSEKSLSETPACGRTTLSFSCRKGDTLQLPIECVALSASAMIEPKTEKTQTCLMIISSETVCITMTYFVFFCVLSSRHAVIMPTASVIDLDDDAMRRLNGVLGAHPSERLHAMPS